MSRTQIKKDAEAQYVQSPIGRSNDGLTSAKPRIEGSSGDATFENDPGAAERDRENHRQTGARKATSRPDVDAELTLDERTHQEAQADGLAESVDVSQEKTRQSDGRNS